MKKLDTQRLQFNTTLLTSEMEKRGIELSYLGSSLIIEARLGAHIEYLDETNINQVPYVTKLLLDNKYYTKKILQSNDISIAQGEEFEATQVADAVVFAQEIGYPVVVKPTMGSNGIHVHMNISTPKELIKAFKDVAGYISDSYFNKILVEKEFEGEEYRVFITKAGFKAAVHRERANVIGDGEHTILQLIEIENYRRMNPRTTCLCTIKKNYIMDKYLADHGISYQDTPKLGEKVYLRPNSNISGGGNCRDITEQVHPSVWKIARKILSAFKGLDYVGIDYMTVDITHPQASQIYIICELNSCPGLSLHTHEETGTYRDAPGAVIDLLFPETTQ